MIIHGDLDENVHISQSIRLIDELVKENKDFEFILMPNEHHLVQLHPYDTRKLWDFFCPFTERNSAERNCGEDVKN